MNQPPTLPDAVLHEGAEQATDQWSAVTLPQVAQCSCIRVALVELKQQRIRASQPAANSCTCLEGIPGLGSQGSVELSLQQQSFNDGHTRRAGQLGCCRSPSAAAWTKCSWM